MFTTVTMMAAKPKLLATDMSTNSPTMIVQSRAAVRKTSAVLLGPPKMECHAPV